jgi:hypothetical protein
MSSLAWTIVLTSRVVHMGCVPQLVYGVRNGIDFCGDRIGGD